MKDGAIVVLVLHVLQEVGNSFGGFIGVDLDHDVAEIGGDFQFRGFLCLAKGRYANAQGQSQGADQLQGVTAHGNVRHGVNAMCVCWSMWWFAQRAQAMAAV